MRAIDFERARIAWTTHEGSHGLWRVTAAARSAPGDAWFLAPGVMAGDVYGQGRLPLQPAYAFQFAASRDRHVMFREPHQAAALQDTDARHSDTFKDVTVDAPDIQVREIPLDGPPAPGQWPLTMRLAVPGTSGANWTLECPVNHLNLRERSDWQIETGPIIVPCDAVEIAGAAKPGGVQLAFAFANRRDQIDLLGFGPAGNGRRGFVHFARLQRVAMSLFTNPGWCR